LKVDISLAPGALRMLTDAPCTLRMDTGPARDP